MVKPPFFHIILTTLCTALTRATASAIQGAQRIDMSALPIGLYIVQTATGEVGRFVKQ